MDPLQTPWAVSVEQVIEAHKTSLTKGLTTRQAIELRAKYGANELAKEDPTPVRGVKSLLAHAILCFAALEIGS